jgi:8-oxo-dGTP pyrophosphatase MutT (NUDIX family)
VDLLPPSSAAVLDLLATARLFDGRDRETLRRIEEFVRANEDCLLRSNLAGHLTGSAFVVDPGRERLLLIHHKALGRWLQPGGHADGDPDLVAVARREAQEETGVGALDLLVPGPWDLDIHRIPERRGVPAHLHYDVRFLFSAAGTDLQSDEREVHAAAWVPLADLASLGIEESVLRPAERISLLQ